ncbi:hypothetical protein ANN_03472 [Periplaneta americana]|uniref:Uncharacterized protein n=1 Tax=Periplaneta americana TaxID=6978 RepID=A0ABQ8U0A1_PERAM|nr:hypothetical protein ANN_03472 [Periplaneta americana]
MQRTSGKNLSAIHCSNYRFLCKLKNIVKDVLFIRNFMGAVLYCLLHSNTLFRHSMRIYCFKWQKWHSRRKIITPSFHFKILEQFIPIFAENSGILVNELRKEVGREVFDVNPYIFACSLDIICESAMGTSINAQRFGSSDYIDAMHKLKYSIQYRNLLHLYRCFKLKFYSKDYRNITLNIALRAVPMKHMKEIFTERIAKPYLLVDFIFNLTKWGKLQAESLKVIHGLTKKVIKERKEQRANESQKIITEDDMNYDVLCVKPKTIYERLELDTLRVCSNLVFIMDMQCVKKFRYRVTIAFEIGTVSRFNCHSALRHLIWSFSLLPPDLS